METTISPPSTYTMPAFKRPSPLWGALIGFFLTAPLLAIMYVGYAAIRLPFAPLDFFDHLARILPGQVITVGIDSMVAVIRGLNLGRTDVVAKSAERALAIAIFLALGVIAGFVYFLIARAIHRNPAAVREDSQRSGMIYGLILGIVTSVIVFLINRSSDPLNGTTFLLILFTAWGMFLGALYGRIASARAVESAAATTFSTTAPVAQPTVVTAPASVNILNRRQFLIQVGAGAATLTVVGAGIGYAIDTAKAQALALQFDESGDIKLPNAGDTVIPAPGTRPEYTRQRNHYRIDVGAGDGPKILEESYKLDVKGLVDNPKQFTLAEVRGLPSFDQYITMSCISNPVGGDLIGTTLWTGTSMRNLLDVVKPKPEAKWIKINAADGFEEYVSVDQIREDERVMLAWNWDNEPLMQQHGFPLRIHVPNLYGMKQPKWITSMEFVEKWNRGYWLVRGWDEKAIVRATSVIDTIAVDAIYKEGSKQFVPIGGIAWAGTRVVSKVQVQIDGGEWVDAQIRKPISDKTWVIWRYDWAFTEGNHNFKVRVVEADGTIQTDARAEPHPSGATGHHERNERLSFA